MSRISLDRLFRGFLACVLLSLFGTVQAGDYSKVLPGYKLRFPLDHGAHPTFRTEWWYITGWVRADGGEELGVQITFFRHRPKLQENNPSAFSPKQLIFAHAAIAQVKHGRLRHDQRAAREGFDLAYAREGDIDVRLDDWRLRREGETVIARIQAREFSLDLSFAPTQSVLQQGEKGFSRKGPNPVQASYYYSLPNLRVSGSIKIDGKLFKVTGSAWLDHEWSSEFLAEQAVGWDWVGLNLSDGGALMAFRLRDQVGNTLWAGGTYRDGRGRELPLERETVAFVPLRRWRSPRTNAQYPVSVRVKAGDFDIELTPFMDDQELDARASTGTVYWEGAVRAASGGKPIGRGYLELTGYQQRVKL